MGIVADKLCCTTWWNYIKPLDMNLLYGDHCATFKSSATCSNFWQELHEADYTYRTATVQGYLITTTFNMTQYKRNS